MAPRGNVPSCLALGLFGLVLAAASLISPNPAFAYTADQQQACTPDAFRLCSSEIPDVERITACMVRNRAQLSPECRIYFRSPEPTPSAMTEPATTRKPTARSEKSKTRKSRRNRKSSATRT